MKKDFENWINNFTKTIATYTYYTDFASVYDKIEKNKKELNILNDLIGSMNIKEDFKNMLVENPSIIKCIPLLLATRNKNLYIEDIGNEIDFDNVDKTYLTNEEIENYIKFMENTGLFELMQKHLINNIIDYAIGIEVGLDSYARKNRSGRIFEEYVEDYLKQNNYNYQKNTTIPSISSTIRFDYIINIGEKIYGIETCYISSAGFKVKEVIKRFKMLKQSIMEDNNIDIIFIIDGQGWMCYKQDLKELYELTHHIYNLHDLKNGKLKL